MRGAAAPGRNGKGAHVDVSMLECLVAADDINFPALLNGEPAARRPRSGMLVRPVGERHVAVQVGGVPAMWTNLTKLMNRPDLAKDERFATPGARRQNWPVLAEILGEWLNTFASVDEAIKALNGARVPSVPMLTPEEIVDHPHMAERGAFPSVNHPVSGTARVTATPFQLDGQPITPTGPVPYTIGENSREVLTELGFSEEKVQALISEGVVTAAD